MPPGSPSFNHTLVHSLLQDLLDRYTIDGIDIGNLFSTHLTETIGKVNDPQADQ